MKDMKRFLLALVVAFISCLGMVAQTSYAQATFTERTHDFGYIQEKKGAVKHTFEVLNTGNKPLIITKVTASCGCTRPEFTTKPIKPGKKGKVKVTFSPYGRPGAFNKQIKVYTTGREKRTTLVITGTVTR